MNLTRNIKLEHGWGFLSFVSAHFSICALGRTVVVEPENQPSFILHMWGWGLVTKTKKKKRNLYDRFFATPLGICSPVSLRLFLIFPALSFFLPFLFPSFLPFNGCVAVKSDGMVEDILDVAMYFF